MTYPRGRPPEDNERVAAGVPIIDLDVAGPGPADDARPGPTRSGFSRPVLAVVMVLLVLAAVGPAGPPAPGLRMVLAANGTTAAAFKLGAGALYTASYGPSNPTSESAVRRFELAGGAQRWARALPHAVQNLQINDGARVLMARSGTDPRVSFLDADTGRVLWGLAAANTSVVTLTDGGALITTDRPEATGLRLAEPRTGRTVWSRTLAGRVSFGPDDLWTGRPSRVVAIGLAGTVTTLDFATGAVLSAGVIGGPLRAESGRVHTVGDNRLVVFRSDARPALTAYSLVPFARLWGAAESGEAVFDCGPVWCLMRPDISAVVAIDPATGTRRWRAGEIAYAGRLDDRFLAGYDHGERPRMSLLDPATGRTLRPIGPVFQVGRLLLQPAEPDQAWVSELDPDGRPHTLGWVDTAAPFGCEVDGRYLACPTTDGPTKVWRLP